MQNWEVHTILKRIAYLRPQAFVNTEVFIGGIISPRQENSEKSLMAFLMNSTDTFLSPISYYHVLQKWDIGNIQWII